MSTTKNYKDKKVQVAVGLSMQVTDELDRRCAQLAAKGQPTTRSSLIAHYLSVGMAAKVAK